MHPIANLWRHSPSPGAGVRKLMESAGPVMAHPWRGPVERTPTPRLSQLRRWQMARTWARLIREAESLWRVNVRDLRRLGALELSQLLQEVPPALKPRVNRWLARYGVQTRLQGGRTPTA
jgi:hypothetical protein